MFVQQNKRLTGELIYSEDYKSRQSAKINISYNNIIQLSVWLYDDCFVNYLIPNKTIPVTQSDRLQYKFNSTSLTPITKTRSEFYARESPTCVEVDRPG